MEQALVFWNIHICGTYPRARELQCRPAPEKTHSSLCTYTSNSPSSRSSRLASGAAVPCRGDPEKSRCSSRVAQHGKHGTDLPGPVLGSPCCPHFVPCPSTPTSGPGRCSPHSRRPVAGPGRGADSGLSRALGSPRCSS